MTQTIHPYTQQTLTEKQRADKLTAKMAAVNLINTPDTLYFDTETTGIDAHAEIIEISAIRADGMVLLNTLVHPARAVSAEAAALTHITNDMLEKAPLMVEVWQQVCSLFAGKHLIAYNAAFDMRMLFQSMQQIEDTRFPPFASCTCAMQLVSNYLAVPGRYKNYKWHKLSEAADILCVPVDTQLHRALADAVLTRDIVNMIGLTL